MLAKYENVLEWDGIPAIILKVAMKFTFSNSRPYLSSLDSLSAGRRVLDQP
jgi:hypothetical protein